ncbi:MAG: biotin/lipoyl-containing protein, partial [Chitinophagales bacterium]
EIMIEISEGKNIIVKYLNVTAPDAEGNRSVYFKLNGQNRHIQVQDKSLNIEVISNKKANGDNEIGAPLQGKLTQILVKAGEKVAKNQPLFLIEAMKMESTIVAPHEGKVLEVVLAENQMVQQDDLVIVLG